jgi:multiple sugar transport system ATP-binding protein
VSRRYPGGVGVSEIDIDIAPGEFFVVVGPTGSGKTTLLRLLSGLDPADAGTIELDGRDVTAAAAGDRSVGMVFQGHALFPHLSVAGNIAFGLGRIRLAPSDRAASVRTAAELVGAEALLERMPHHLSGGERRRVAIARMLVRERSLFLLDEPLSGLDAHERASIRRRLHDLQRRTATTMVLVTHDQVEALSLGDHVAVLTEGVVRQVGSPLECYRRPVDMTVAGFLGAPPMNILEATNAEGVIRSGPFRVPVSTFSWASSFPDRLLLGVRPEDARITAGSSHRIRSVEQVGVDAYLFLEGPLGGLVVRARLDDPIPVGSSVGVDAEPASACLFDAESGRAVAWRT